MGRPLEPHDGITRQYSPEVSIHEGPGGLQVPVCTFDALIRTIEIEDPVVSQVFEAAFPAFKAGEKHYRQYDPGGRYRRYAGSSGTLDSRSYFSVARWNGQDDGSLIREIFAYTVPAEAGVVMIDDMSDSRDVISINKKYGSSFEAGEYLLLFVHEPERLVTREFQELAAARGALPNFFKVLCATRHLRCERVVDLRLPAVQGWFFDTFSKEEWLNIHLPLPPVRSFFELLVVMLGQNRGDNAMTQAVGRELRIWGIGGLVYPSARCDSAVVVENARVIDWYGWNLVDYEKTRENAGGKFDPMAAVSITTMDELADIKHGAAYFGLPLGQFKVNYADQGSRRGTWQVQGLETLNLRRWISTLSPSQRQLLGLPGDAGLVELPNDALDEVEKRLRTDYQALAKAKGPLPIDEDRLRHLLGELARVLAQVPGGGRAAINIDTMERKLDLGPLRDAFVESAISIGVLVEDAKGYVRFDHPETLDYFTTVP